MMSELNKKIRKLALSKRKLNRYKKLQQLLILLITKPELLHGRQSNTLIRNELKQKGINCCYNTISAYYKLLKISENQKEITDRNIRAFHDLKPK